MRKLVFVFVFTATLGGLAYGQTKESEKSTRQNNKKEVSKSGSGCCSPSSKAKAMLQGKPTSIPKKEKN